MSQTPEFGADRQLPRGIFGNLHRAAAVLVVALSLVLASAGSALAAPTLAGEAFTWSGPPGAGDVSCSPITGSFSYEALPPDIAGPTYPGSFAEVGNITFAGGVVTAWDATFDIYSPLGAHVASGATHLAPGGGRPVTCTPSFLTRTGSASAVLTYTATFDGAAGTDTGAASATVSFANTLGVTAGTFTETFGAPLPIVQPGCNTTGNGNGNDECNQSGNN